MARKENEKVGIFNCHGMGGNQVFSYTANKEIRTDDLCLDVSKLNGPVTMLKCHHLKGNQLWEYDPVKLTLQHVNSNQCLDKATEEDSQVPSIRDCTGSRSQQWLLRNVTLPEIFWDQIYNNKERRKDWLGYLSIHSATFFSSKKGKCFPLLWDVKVSQPLKLRLLAFHLLWTGLPVPGRATAK